MLFIILVLFFILGANIFLIIFLSRRAKKKHVRELLGFKLFLVRFPKTISRDGKELKQEISLSEQFFSSLLSFKKPIIFEVAVPHIGEEIHFYVGIPERFVDTFSRQLQSIWPDANIEESPDYTIFNTMGDSSALYIKQKEAFPLPFRTYTEIGSDTFSSILGGLSKINEIGEGGAIQFIICPASSSAKKHIFSSLEALKKGKSLKSVLNSQIINSSDFLDALTKGENKKEEEKIINEDAVQAFQSKFSKPLFEVNVRIVTSASSKEKADILLEGITAGFSQFSAPNRNECILVKPRNRSRFIYEFIFREFSPLQRMVLSSEELVSIFHFPTAFTEVPKIKQIAFKETPPPADLPKDGIRIGISKFRSTSQDIRITREDRRRHLYVIGQTGTGKSVFLNNLAGQDMNNGEGICLMDPNGDLFEDVLARVPSSRLKDVIVFDPGDLSRPLGLNMLEYDSQFPEQKTFIINELMTIFDTLYDLKATGGPMFEQYARNALLLLMDDPNDAFTILEIPRVLSDAIFRKKLLEKCKNFLTKDFWEKEAEKAGGEASLQNLVPYISSKFNTFIANDYVRPIIAQSKTTLNFRTIMDEGKILMINLSKGKIGDLNSSLLGMIIIGKLTIAAFARGETSIEKRRDFYLYIDEFQNFTTPSIATILSEARKYRLNLALAHQFIGQLSEKIRDAVFGNVGSMIAFRVGADDAEFLEKQFAPTFSQNNLTNIDNLNAHAKILINGKVTSPFNLFVPFPPKGDVSHAQLIKEHSRLVYGRPREIVEQEIYSRVKNN